MSHDRLIYLTQRIEELDTEEFYCFHGYNKKKTAEEKCKHLRYMADVIEERAKLEQELKKLKK